MTTSTQTANHHWESLRVLWYRDWLRGLLLVVAVLFAYQPVWHAGFIWDDDVYVANNQLLTAPDGLKRIWFSLDSPSQYFPLTYTTFRLERALWGLNPTGYHGVNILLHAAAALLVWWLLKRLRVPGAWLAAAIFALHPVQVESVAWITERKNILSLLFFLLAVLAWIEFVEDRPKPKPRWRWYFLSLFFFALALFSKTTACTLPAALLLVLWLQGKPVDWVRLVQMIPFLLLGAGMGLVTVWWERYHQGTQGILFSYGPVERLLIASHAVWFYLGKLVWPVNLMFSYPRWTINAANPLAYGWLVAGIGLGAVIYFARRFTGRGLEVAALFYVATLSPLLGFIMLYTFYYSFVADHYQYVASIGPIALAAGSITRALGTGGKSKLFVKLMLCGMLLLVLGVLTWRQSRMYASLETLWGTTVARNPNSFMAQNNFGVVLSKKGQVEGAIAHYQKALEFQPDYALAHYNLGSILAQQGRLDEAIPHFKSALETIPNYVDAHISLGNALLKTGSVDEAMAQFQKALQLKPDDADAHINLGNALLKKGLVDEAIAQFQQAVQLKPGYAQAHNNLGDALLKTGRWDEALAQFQQALQLKPDYAEACFNLGNALNKQGRLDEALAYYQQALQLKPDYAKAHINLGNALMKQGNAAEAITHFQKALQIAPGSAEAQNNLAWVLATSPDARIRDGARAVRYAERACELTHQGVTPFVSTLAAAYAEAGRFDEAMAAAQKACALAAAAGEQSLLENNQKLLALYRAHQPYHETAEKALPAAP